MGTGGLVALQTACAAVSGEGEPWKIRVLLDAGRIGSGLVRSDKPPKICSLEMSYTRR